MSGEQRRKEKDNIFGQGSRTPVAITLLVRNPKAAKQGQIRFHDIGDYLTRGEKLAAIARFGSVGGIEAEGVGWNVITPDEHGDWLKKRDNSFNAFVAMGGKDGTEKLSLFANYSSGVKTQRDAWACNPSREAAAVRMGSMIGFYNKELDRFDVAHPHADRKAREAAVGGFVNADPHKISWTHNLKQELARGKRLVFVQSCQTLILYRPLRRSGCTTVER